MSDIDKLTAALMADFSQSGISELNLASGDFEIYLSSSSRARRTEGVTSRSTARPIAPAPAAQAMPVEVAQSAPVVADLPSGAKIVTAPNLGTFYRAPKPGAVPFVEIGESVAAGDELCLIEVMKLFTAVRTECAGRLHSVLAEDGSMVEAGQPLFALVID